MQSCQPLNITTSAAHSRAFCMHLLTFSMLIESGNPYVVVDHPGLQLAFYDCSTSSKWKLMRPEWAFAPFFL